VSTSEAGLGEHTWDSWPRGNAIVNVPVTTVWASPEAARPIDAPIVGDSVEPSRWMAKLDHDARLDLLDRVSTQALLGEPVRVVRERAGWSEIRLPWQPTSLDPAGYPGWVRSAHLGEDLLTGRPLTVQRTRLARVAGQTLSIGSCHGADEEGEADTAFDHGDLGHRFVHLLEEFLGLPYLWGGLSGWGVDCSGLIHLCARALGLLIPRDSGDLHQAALDRSVTLPLLFFRHADGHANAGRIRHVAYDLGDGLMFHAPRTGYVVEVLDRSMPPYVDDLVGS
jgi:gamma-D-glutamyl-L-lysine dipeptidyl-peptidase